MESIPEKRISWVYNILEGKKEQDLVVHQDDDFVLLPDSKWDQKDVSCMYTLAIVKRRDLRSLRDLRGEHLPMLEHIREKTLAAIYEKYGNEASTIRAYVHYLPSFWHLHIHFNAIYHLSPYGRVTLCWQGTMCYRAPSPNSNSEFTSTLNPTLIV